MLATPAPKMVDISQESMLLIYPWLMMVRFIPIIYIDGAIKWRLNRLNGVYWIDGSTQIKFSIVRRREVSNKSALFINV